MILTCPECTTSYEAPSELLGPTGRKVKCHKCSHIWLAMPDENAGNSEAVEEVEATPSEPDASVVGDDFDLDDLEVRSTDTVDEPEPGEEAPTGEADNPDLDTMSDEEASDFGDELESDDGAEDGEPDAGEIIEIDPGDQGSIEDVESIASVSRSLNQGSSENLRFPIARIRKFGAIAAALVLLLGGLYTFRYQVVRFAPGSAMLYGFAGFEVNLRGLEFRDIVYAREFEDGIPVLAVRGEIVNVTENPVMLPTIRFSLRDSRAQEVYHWTGSAGPDLLAPSGVVPFESRLASPPVGAQEILVRFAGR